MVNHNYNTCLKYIPGEVRGRVKGEGGTTTKVVGACNSEAPSNGFNCNCLFSASKGGKLSLLMSTRGREGVTEERRARFSGVM